MTQFDIKWGSRKTLNDDELSDMAHEKWCMDVLRENPYATLSLMLAYLNEDDDIKHEMAGKLIGFAIYEALSTKPLLYEVLTEIMDGHSERFKALPGLVTHHACKCGGGSCR